MEAKVKSFKTSEITEQGVKTEESEHRSYKTLKEKSNNMFLLNMKEKNEPNQQNKQASKIQPEALN